MPGSLAWDDAPVGISEGSATARAALAGNPSDVFGGAVLATAVPGLVARVRASDADEVVVGDRSWPSPSEVTGPHEGDEALLGAAVERLVGWCRETGRVVPADGVALAPVGDAERPAHVEHRGTVGVAGAAGGVGAVGEPQESGERRHVDEDPVARGAHATTLPASGAVP